MYQKEQKNKVQHSNVSKARVQQQKSKGFVLDDNRSSSIIQQKKVDAIHTAKPIQKKKNNTGLPDNLKSGMESISGHALDDVKVHYNSAKPAQLNAHAYAQGTNIHIASGQEKHLPHEAWHVVQQKQGRVKPTMKKNGVAINDNVGLEKEADVMGAKALQRKVVSNETAQLQEVAQLGKKARKAAATARNAKKKEKKKKQEHTRNARPSSLAKHQKGQAAKKNSVEDSAFRAYKRRGGFLSKSAWKSQGQPRR